MKLNPIVLFGLAGALGLAGFLATQQYLSGQEDEQKVPVLVAKTEIRVGDPVSLENAGFKEIAVSALPPQPIVNPEQFEGLFAGSRFLPGEVMVQGKVSSQFGNDSRRIPKGLRIHTILVSKTTSHAGLLQSGDRVDVLGLLDIAEIDPVTGRRDNFKQIKTILGDVEVWAVGRDVVGDDQSGSGREGQKDTSRRESGTVSLLVDPTQAVTLAGAESVGRLFISLRHPDDDVDTGDISFNTAELYKKKKDQNVREEEPAEPAPVAAAPAQPSLASRAAGALSTFLAREADGAADRAAADPTDVPTWTVMLHVGTEVRMNEVVDVPAARAAGFTEAQIAAKRRELRDPDYARRAAERRAARLAANPLTGLNPNAPAGPPPVPAATASSDDPPTPAVDGAPGDAADADDGLFPLPAP